MTIRRRRDTVREATVRQLSHALGDGTFMDPDTLRLLGLNLYELIFFNAHANEWFEQVYENATDLRIVLEFQPEDVDLMAIPWEFLYVPKERWRAGGKYIVRQPKLSLVRRVVRKAADATEIVRPRFLIVDCMPASADATQPGYQTASQAGRMCASAPSPEIDQVMAFLETFGDVRCVRFPTIPQLDDAVAGIGNGGSADPPHVVHLVGHGRFQSGDDAAFEFCLSPRGDGRWERDDRIAEAIGAHTPELVVLQTCKGGKADNYQRHEGAAITLVKRGVPNVVALQQQILVGEATRFVTSFYEALQQGRPADVAVKEGRQALTRSDGPAFGLPVAYFQRDAGFSLPRTPVQQTSAPSSTPTEQTYRGVRPEPAPSRSPVPAPNAPAGTPAVVEAGVHRAPLTTPEPSQGETRPAGSPLSVRLGSKDQ